MKTCSIQVYDVGTLFYRANKGDFDFGVTNETSTVCDWGNSVYFSQSPEIAQGYLEEGARILLNFVNKVPVRYILCCHPCFKTGTYEEHMQSRINEIESLIGVLKPSGEPFMKWLGSYGYAFQCFYESESDRMETAIPFQLLKSDNWQVTE